MGIPFGRYTLLRKIASGGMGQVLLGKKGADGFEKLVVIKRILPHLVEDEEFFAMFQDEARITMRLDHPNIARINEFGEEHGIHFIEMEYVAGEDLRRLDKRARAAGTPIPLGVILRVIADAAAGLDFAHKAKDSKGNALNLVHRDVSPQNVLIGFDGSVKLIDFGVAKAIGRAQHTATGILKGKFPYMSPEQADGRDIDARSDVFSLGIVLWELLVGRRLFKGESDVQTQRLVKACQVPAPSTLAPALSSELDDIVLKSLARNKEHRYKDAAAFRMALEEYALSRRIPASNAHIVTFMQSLYAERIEKEARPEFMEETSGLTGVDLGLAGVKSSTEGGTPSARLSTGTRAKALDQAAPPRRGLGVLIGALVVALIGAVGVGAYLAGKGGDPKVPTEPVRTQPQQVTIIQPPPERPKAPQRMEVNFDSEPQGAMVMIAGAALGQTPVSLSLDRGQLPTQLRMELDGFEPLEIEVNESTGSQLKLKLKPKVVKRPTGTVGAPRPPPPSEIKTTR